MPPFLRRPGAECAIFSCCANDVPPLMMLCATRMHDMHACSATWAVPLAAQHTSPRPPQGPADTTPTIQTDAISCIMCCWVIWCSLAALGCIRGARGHLRLQCRDLPSFPPLERTFGRDGGPTRPPLLSWGHLWMLGACMGPGGHAGPTCMGVFNAKLHQLHYTNCSPPLHSWLHASTITAQNGTWSAQTSVKLIQAVRMQKQKRYSTGDSQEITQPSTNPAQAGLSCEF